MNEISNLVDELENLKRRKDSDLENRIRCNKQKVEGTKRRKKEHKGKLGKKIAVIGAAGFIVGSLAIGGYFLSRAFNYSGNYNAEDNEIIETGYQEIQDETIDSKIDEVSPDYIVIVQKDDSLWNITKDYFKDKGIKINDENLRNAVNEIAVYNGKVRLGEYKTGMESSLNPSILEIGQEIKIPWYLMEKLERK